MTFQQKSRGVQMPLTPVVHVSFLHPFPLSHPFLSIFSCSAGGSEWVLTCSYLRASVHEWPCLLNSNGNQLLLPRSSLFQRQVIFLPAIAFIYFFLGTGRTRGNGFIWELHAALSLELAVLSWQGSWTLDRNFFWLALFYLLFLWGAP